MGRISLPFERNYFIVGTILHGFQIWGVRTKIIELLQLIPLWIGRHNRISVAQPLHNIWYGFIPCLLCHKSGWSNDNSGYNWCPIIYYPLICEMMTTWSSFKKKIVVPMHPAMELAQYIVIETQESEFFFSCFFLPWLPNNLAFPLSHYWKHVSSPP